MLLLFSLFHLFHKNIFELIKNSEHVVRIDTDTFASLQIFHRDYHPVVGGGGGDKEGLSVFGILNKTITTGGTKLLKFFSSS